MRVVRSTKYSVLVNSFLTVKWFIVDDWRSNQWLVIIQSDWINRWINRRSNDSSWIIQPPWTKSTGFNLAKPPLNLSVYPMTFRVESFLVGTSKAPKRCSCLKLYSWIEILKVTLKSELQTLDWIIWNDSPQKLPLASSSPLTSARTRLISDESNTLRSSLDSSTCAQRVNFCCFSLIISFLI